MRTQAHHGASCGGVLPRIRRDRVRVLCVADVRGWIFDRHIGALTRLIGSEFDFVPHYYWDKAPYDEAEYDLVYILEWNLVREEFMKTRGKHVTGIRSHVAWAGRSPADLAAWLGQRFAGVHTVSARLQSIFAPHLPGLRYVTHGVDVEHFSPTTVAGSRPGPLRVGWAGNRRSPGDKGFDDILSPLVEVEGVELTHCGYSDNCLDIDAMTAFYDGIDVYCCASRSEGSNNSLLEAAAMARGIVTTDTGTVPEYLRHGESALIVPRSPEAFREAVTSLSKAKSALATMGDLARRGVAERFDWRERAKDYREFFLNALGGYACRAQEADE